jgi:hypothetical protein
MEREFQCPSCGASNKVTNPGVLMRICDYCKTAMYWDKGSALRAGRKSMDLPPSARFRVGASGKIKGRSFRVLGRLSYAHEKGTWNEWFVEMSDGNIMWLTEDEREVFLESPLKVTGPLPAHSELSVGKRIELDGKVGVIEEIGEARCLGGEGQIPFQVEVGEVYPYADGAAPDGSFSFGLEYDPATGNAEAFIGQILGFKDAKAGPEVRETPESHTGEMVRCPSCGKPYEGPRVATTDMVVCVSCGSALQLDEAESRVVGKNRGKQPLFTLSIGMPVTLEGVRYEVMGRLWYVESDEGVQYVSKEYVLYNAESGYLWLSEENGHFTVSRTMHVHANVPPIPVAKMKVTVGDEVFKVYENGELTLKWVDGALPWVAVVGEMTQYVHMIKPPYYVDQEVTGKEIELFRGRYVSHEELQAGLPQDLELPHASGIYSCQPYIGSAWTAGTWKIGAAFLIVNLLLLFYSLAADKKTPLLKENITAAQYSQEHLTRPFEVAKNSSILELEGSAPLNNSWLGVDFAVVDSQDRVLSQQWGETSFYQGSDSEGYWSEGSNSFDSYFKVDKAGTYRLLVYGQGGSGDRGPARNEPLTVRVTGNRTISWYFIFPLLICGFVAVLEPVARAIFESRRWSSVAQGDDDGSDSDD